MRTAPILFSAPMIRALYNGRKTQTRRILKPQPTDANSKFRGFAGVSDTKAVFTSDFPAQPETVRLPYSVGDRLWVRESWRCNSWAADVATIFYKAHENCSYTEMHEQFPIAGQKGIAPSQSWKPSIHMPRWISRLTLTITNVRIERLQDISEEDAMAEGITMTLEDSPACAWFSGIHTNTNLAPENMDGWHFNDAQAAFQDLWNKINGANAWDANPWVIALTFTVQHGNIDEVAA
ncbi:hypothetical protein [Pseudochrobactrum kiredjianiae]|uniref:Morphogenetic protein n=1 Tax=Pseudochrobactrum kiredjianiae TaxID=386305 RepID=A0ABW3V1A6_9HYPH